MLINRHFFYRFHPLLLQSLSAGVCRVVLLFQLVSEVVFANDVDIRRDLLSAVIVTGGLALTRGSFFFQKTHFIGAMIGKGFLYGWHFIMHKGIFCFTCRVRNRVVAKQRFQGHF